MNSSFTVRNAIRQALVDADPARAVRMAQDAARRDSTPQCWQVVHRALRAGNAVIDGLFDERASLRIAVAASFTAQNLVPYLDVVCLLSGINAKIYVLPYNQFQTEFRNPASELHQFKPHVTLFFAELIDLIGEVGPFQDGGAFEESMDNAKRAVVDVAKAYRAHGAGHLLVHNFIAPSVAAEGVLENRGLGMIDFHRRLNAALPGALGETQDVFVMDLDHLASRSGSEAAMNRRMRYLARMPLSETFAQELARLHAAHFRALCGKTRKCLVLDLDNVLWGGVVGEDGVMGVAIGDESPGSVYRDIQIAVRRLYRRGAILALASKNNPEDALAVFEQRKEMVLRREDFAAIEIGWGDKASALRRIARHLDIGLDALVFLDDSPQERLLVQTELPEVEVMPFPEDVCALPDALLGCGWFDTFHLTQEDSRRGQMYAQRQQRHQAGAQAADLTAFLNSLELMVDVSRAQRGDIPRVAQLTQRTNQFNLTTRRYTEAQIAAMLNDPAWLVLTLSTRDRFGDEGMVGLSLTHVEGPRGEIDSFLLSCRVLGRGIEQAFLAATLQLARQAGAAAVSAQYVPTKKNAQVENFYSRHGFSQASAGAGGVKYELNGANSGPEVPAWIEMRTPVETPDRLIV